MSSLWTPQGEHRVPREPDDRTASPGRDAAPAGTEPPGAGAASRATGQAPARARARDAEAGGPSEEDLRRLTEELASAPVEDVVANHCYGLFELAALHLSVQPARLDSARLAIDSLGLLVDGLGERLGPYAKDLSEGLNQLRLAFVKLSQVAGSGNGPSEA